MERDCPLKEFKLYLLLFSSEKNYQLTEGLRPQGITGCLQCQAGGEGPSSPALRLGVHGAGFLSQLTL